MLDYRGVAFCLLPFIVYAVLAAEADPLAEPKKRVCPSCAVKCSAKVGPYAWGIADGVCKVFTNGCMLMSENCQRQGKCLSAMNSTTKEECQKSCQICKSKVREIPVCASYLNSSGKLRQKSKTFPSQCKLDRSACLMDKPYSYVSRGACRKSNFSKIK